MNLLYPFGFEDMRRLPCFRGKGDLCELIALIATSDEHINLKRKVLILAGAWKGVKLGVSKIP